MAGPKVCTGMCMCVSCVYPMLRCMAWAAGVWEYDATTNADAVVRLFYTPKYSLRVFLQFDVATEKGLAAFSGFMGTKSYVEGYSMTGADTEYFSKFTSCPDVTKYPHAYRWYIHINALSGGASMAAPPAPAPAAAPAPAPAPAPAAKDDDDDFDVFGDEEEADEAPKESRVEMLARLKKEAEERTAKKEANQRTLVGLEIKPWSMETDLMELWKKITTTIVQPGLKWGENCQLVDVAFGIKKIQTTFVMGVNNSSDDVQEAIEAMEDEVQSVEILSMNVL